MDMTGLVISATKPAGKVARMLADTGVAVSPIVEDEGNVDRYILSKRLAVERRTGSSFLKGIMEKTLFTSAIYLREHFRIPILVVEGRVGYDYTGFDPRAVRGAMTSMMLEYGLSVLATPTVEETVALIAMMARQEQIGIPEISLIPKRKAADLPDIQRRVVEMLPGCGMVMARELLQHFGSVRRVMGSTPDELRSMRGIGGKKAADMHKVINAEYEAVDTERNLEDAIEAEPGLLFGQPVQLLARQHVVFTEAKEKHVVDMVFLDPKADEIILVELKRGRLTREHVRQLRRYLDHAGESKLLRSLLEGGTTVRGILATVEECALTGATPGISTRIVSSKRAIAVLAKLRRRWLRDTAEVGDR